MLTLTKAAFRYPGAASDSLHDVDLELAPGSVTGLLGGSESGKSTLCLVLSGLAPRVTGGRLQGSLRLDGEDTVERPMHELVDDIAMGFQDPMAQLSMVADTVAQEVAFGPANLGVPVDELRARVDAALELSGIVGLAGRDPGELSLGEQQLVAIAGLLALRPRHLILDEPTSHLDRHGRQRVAEMIGALAASGCAVLVAERDVDIIERTCSSSLVIGGGRVLAAGPTAGVLDGIDIDSLGIAESSTRRLRRLARSAGLDSSRIENEW